MLEQRVIDTIKATLPAVAAAGPALAEHFYNRMLSGNPELKEVFNLSNQRNLAQPRALFNAVAAYASNLNNLSALGGAVEHIAQKHASFNIRPDQYPIVGGHLLATLQEKLQVNDEQLEAWRLAYQQLADIFIQREAQIYQQAAEQHGGWRDARRFRIQAIDTQSSVIKSLALVPIDGQPVMDFRAGQYLSVMIKPPGFAHRAIRQYSLTRSPDGRSYRIAVKQEPQGTVSGWLHQQARVGDEIAVTIPSGDFYLDVSPQTPVTLISAGVGQTPMLAMLHQLAATDHQGQVNWLHVEKARARHAFADEVQQLGQRLARFNAEIWYSQPGEAQQQPGTHSGRMALLPLEGQLSAPGMAFYLCGPFGFMQDIARQLTALQVEPARIHYEVFGPDKVL